MTTSGVELRCTVEEQQLFQLLTLLQVHEAAAKHGVELTPTCFRKPNAKGLELVLYRAYALIHGETRAAKVAVASCCAALEMPGTLHRT
jgi:hypothetical protein